MCWEQNAPPGQVMAQSIPAGRVSRSLGCFRETLGGLVCGKELCGSNAAACKRSDDRRPLGFLLRQPSW